MDDIKSNLLKYYNLEAEHRDSQIKEDWKSKERERFLDFTDKKGTLLEIGAGPGHDSKFFMDKGLKVSAIDFSAEMVKKCKEKAIDAYELDFYNLSALNKKFDYVWAMNCLLHVPKSDLPMVLKNIDDVLNSNGLFYMGVYGGEDWEHDFINSFSEIPRFFSSYSEAGIKEVLKNTPFEILSFVQLDKSEIGTTMDFQSIIMRRV